MATKQDNYGDLDDFMDSIGMDIKPTGPEDALMILLDAGKGYKEIHNLRYWVRHELYVYHFVVNDGCIMVKDNTLDNKRYTKRDYARAIIEYYLRMKYHPWFTQDMRGLGKADIKKMCELVMAHAEIAPLIAAKTKDEMPINNTPPSSLK